MPFLHKPHEKLCRKLESIMQKILSASRRFSDAARKKLEAELNGEFESRVVSELDRLTVSSGIAPDSAE